MATSDTVRQFLEAQDIRFSLVKCPWDAQGRWQGGGEAISHAAVARPVILKDEKGLVMVTMPITGRLDLGAMNRQLGRHLKVVEKDEFPTVFAQCTSFILPALAALAGLECVLDGALLEQENVYIASGNGEQMIRLSTEDFERLNPGLRIGKSLLPSEASGKDHKMPANTDKVIKINGSLPLADMRQRIENTTQLPPMPSLAHKILQLNANPYAHAEDLAKLLEKDPSLTAQIVRYAQSPFFGYQSKVASVRQAISLVLGYDMVMNIALGFAVGRPFNIPMEGPLGLRDFWRHSIYSASLSQALCDFMPRGTPFQPGMAYLTGLLHNFGLLILGHLFPKEFGLLHKAVIQEPQTPQIGRAHV